jgi:hypothetical protein
MADIDPAGPFFAESRNDRIDRMGQVAFAQHGDAVATDVQAGRNMVRYCWRRETGRENEQQKSK